MKTLFTLLIALGLCSASISAQDFSVNKSLNSPVHSFDVLNYTLELDLYNNYSTPYPKSFTGSNILKFRVDTTLNSIMLNAVNFSLEIESVSMAGISFTQESDILTINLDNTYNPGDTVEVKIDYNHKDVVDNAFNVGGGFVFTFCEPEGARNWFPCWDKPSDKATIDLTAKVPSDVQLASNGHLEDSTLVADTLYYRWISRDPISTYLIVITSSNNYILDIMYWDDNSTTKDENIPIRFYYQPGEDPSFIQSIILPMTDFFSEIFGTYPFEKNGLATVNNLFPALGMEHQSMITLCEDCWIEFLTAHEVAHQWFSAMIGPATWADVWLSESFATYGDALWTEHAYGYVPFKNQIEGNADYYLANNPGWALSDPDWAINTPSSGILFNYAVTYMKSSCVLHMLRYVLGDEDFFVAVKDYATDSVNFMHNTATTVDFVAKINESTGQDLNWFFDQWVYFPNHPIYENTYNFIDNGNGMWDVNFKATQIQTNAPFFTMPLELYIYFTDFTDTTIRVFNDENDQEFSFPFDKEPYYFFFDNGNNILLKEATLITGIIENNIKSQNPIKLHQNIPNPFNSSTEISYTVTVGTNVKLSVFDLNNNLISVLEEGWNNPGRYTHKFGKNSLPSGIYYYRIEAGKYSRSLKMVIN